MALDVIPQAIPFCSSASENLNMLEIFAPIGNWWGHPTEESDSNQCFQ